MKKVWKRFDITFVLIVVVILILVAPIICVIKCERVGDTNLLSYYGGVAGGILTIAGVFLTVAYSQKQYENGQRNAVIPYFAVNMLKSHYASLNDYISSKINNSGDLSESDTLVADSKGYYEYKVVDYFFVIENEGIKIQSSLSEDQKRKVEGPDIKRKEIAKVVSVAVPSDDVYNTVDYENVGNGSAVNFRIGFNRKDSKDKQFSYSISVRQAEHVTAHIYAENCDAKSEKLGNYELEIRYEDIFGNKYIQTTDIIIDYDQRGLAVTTNMYQKQDRG